MSLDPHTGDPAIGESEAATREAVGSEVTARQTPLGEPVASGKPVARGGPATGDEPVAGDQLVGAASASEASVTEPVGEASRSEVSSVLTGDADPAGLPDDVVETSLLIGTLFRRMFSYGDGGSALRLMDQHGLSFLEFKSMLELGAADRATEPCLQDIADATGASMPSVSRAVDSLVKKDLALRIEDPEDRRRRILGLTPEGREMVHQILLGRATGVMKLAAGFTPDERAALNEVLGRLVRRDDLARIYSQLEEAMGCEADHNHAETESGVAR